MRASWMASERWIVSAVQESKDSTDEVRSVPGHAKTGAGVDHVLLYSRRCWIVRGRLGLHRSRQKSRASRRCSHRRLPAHACDQHVPAASGHPHHSHRHRLCSVGRHRCARSIPRSGSASWSVDEHWRSPRWSPRSSRSSPRPIDESPPTTIRARFRGVADGISDAIRYAFDGTQGCRCLKRNRCRLRALRKLPRTLEVGTDPCMTLTDLGQLNVGRKCMEHRSMSFLSRIGTLVGARPNDARIRGSASADGAGSSRTVR